MCVGLSVNRPVRQTWHAFQNDISRYCTACTAVHPDGAHIPVRVCRARRKDRRPSVRRSAIPSRLRLRTPRYGRGACAMLVLGSSCAHRGRGAPRTAESEHCALESSNNSECLHAPQNVLRRANIQSSETCTCVSNAHLCAHLRASHCSMRALRAHRCYRVGVKRYRVGFDCLALTLTQRLTLTR